MVTTGRRLIRVKVGMLGRESVFICPEDLEIKGGDTVVAGRTYGLDWGRACGPAPDNGQEITETILRVAREDDLAAIESLSDYEDDALLFRRFVDECGLEMKLTGIDHSLDGGKITFYFLADGRIDFRELVRLLNHEYCRRIELYQLNLEDQFQFIPTCGICGLEVCCRKMHALFGMKVSTRVCRDQRLAYNPLKMSGCCGKARCCFTYEHANYAEYAKHLPKLGGRIKYRGIEFRLDDWDIFSKTVVLSNQEYEFNYEVAWDEFKTYALDENAPKLLIADIVPAAARAEFEPSRQDSRGRGGGRERGGKSKDRGGNGRPPKSQKGG